MKKYMKVIFETVKVIFETVIVALVHLLQVSLEGVIIAILLVWLGIN